MNDDRLLQALKALAEQDSFRVAPPRVEAHLLESVRRRRRTKVIWQSAIAATVVMGVAITAISIAAVSGERRSTPTVAAIPNPSPTPIAPSTKPTGTATATRKATMPSKSVAAAPQEIATDFFPLMDAPPPLERGELVRVLLPASAMRVVGLPVREDRLADPVQADVLIGEEGMARAIRFVSFEQ